MRKIYKCNIDCSVCPNKALQTVGIECNTEKETLDVLFIKDQPDERSLIYNPYTGKADQLLRTLIKKVFPINVGFTYAIRCRGMATPETFHYCKQALLHDINYFKPKVIIPLGKKALDLIDGSKGSIRFARGLIWETTIGGVKVIVSPTWTAGQFFSNFNLIGSFLQDLRLIKQYITFGKNPFTVDSNFSYTLLDTVEKVKTWVDKMIHHSKGKFLAFDTETKNVNKRWDQKLGTLQFYDGEEAVVIPFMNPQSPWVVQELKEVKKALKQLFTEPVSFKAFLCHNGKFEQVQVMNFITDGNTFKNAPMLDTMNGMHLLDENRKELGYGLETVARELLGFTGYKDYKTQRSDALNMKDLYKYGALDAYVTYNLFFAEKSLAEIMGFSKWLHLLSRLTFKAITGISSIEYNGFYGDLKQVQYLKADPMSIIKKRKKEILEFLKLKDTVKEANSLYSKNKNITNKNTFSFKQKNKIIWNIPLNKKQGMITLFIEVLGLKALSYGKQALCLRKKRGFCKIPCKQESCSQYKKPEASIGKDFFEKYDYIEEVSLIHEWVKLDKLEDSFINPLCDFLNPNFTGYINKDVKQDNKDHSTDSRIRSSYLSIGTVTGRFSSKKPNMQQIPRGKDPAPNSIKNLFKAQNTPSILLQLKKGLEVDPKLVRCLVQVDYKANEVGWWCINSQDPVLASKLIAGKEAILKYKKNPTKENLADTKIYGDIHKQTASQMFNVPITKVTKEQRQAVKAIVFGLMFGRSVKSIALQLSSTQKKKEESNEEYNDKIKNYCTMFDNQFVIASKYLKELPEIGAKYGYVESPIGRRRTLHAYYVGNLKLLNRANNQAKNSPIQGIASDAASIGVSLVNDYIIKHKKDWQLTAMVHDSLITELPLTDLFEYCEQVEKLMTIDVMNYMKNKFNVSFNAPIQVDFEISTASDHAWGSLESWDYSKPDLQRIYKLGYNGD